MRSHIAYENFTYVFVFTVRFLVNLVRSLKLAAAVIVAVVLLFAVAVAVVVATVAIAVIATRVGRRFKTSTAAFGRWAVIAVVVWSLAHGCRVACNCW